VVSVCADMVGQKLARIANNNVKNENFGFGLSGFAAIVKLVGDCPLALDENPIAATTELALVLISLAWGRQN
jgi:hypothetical protein